MIKLPPRNPYCSRCGDLRGGVYGHETNECTWNRPPEPEQEEPPVERARP